MSDKKAFEKVLERLENDLGGLIDLISHERTTREITGRDWFPWWAVVRALFPIAESLGDLIYQEPETGRNLVRILKEELIKRNSGYSNAGIIVSLFRHTLMHQDEMRVLRAGGIQVGWRLSFDQRSDHLKVEEVSLQPKEFLLQFDTTCFYDDLVRLCKEKVLNLAVGAGQRYLDWQSPRDLDTAEWASRRISKEAKAEIQALTPRP